MCTYLVEYFVMDVVGCVFFFFFQAEDGIRDIGVTGVQTCALPIWASAAFLRAGSDCAKPRIGKTRARDRARPRRLIVTIMGSPMECGNSNTSPETACQAIFTAPRREASVPFTTATFRFFRELARNN